MLQLEPLVMTNQVQVSSEEVFDDMFLDEYASDGEYTPPLIRILAEISLQSFTSFSQYSQRNQ